MTSQELATPAFSQTNQYQSLTSISFQENPYTFEERHALLSEHLIPVVRHAPLSEPQYKPTYSNYPSLQRDLKRIRHPCQNQNQTSTKARQLIHPRINRNLTTPRIHFLIPSSPSLNL